MRATEDFLSTILFVSNNLVRAKMLELNSAKISLSSSSSSSFYFLFIIYFLWWQFPFPLFGITCLALYIYICVCVCVCVSKMLELNSNDNFPFPLLALCKNVQFLEPPLLTSEIKFQFCPSQNRRSWFYLGYLSKNIYLN